MRARLVVVVIAAAAALAAGASPVEEQQRRLRVLEATLEATARNPADYTAWQARRSALLLAPGTDPASLETELHTTAAEAVLRAPKCFQTWHHRRCVLDRLLFLLPPPSEGKARELLRAELAWGWARLVGEGADPKNVHAWAHRRWVLERAMEAEEGGSVAAAVALLQAEMALTRTLLEDGDWGNNSAWCCRHGLLRRLLALGPGGGEAEAEAWAFRFCKAELLLTTKLLRRDPDNPSAWAHLRGLLSPSLPYPPAVHRRLRPLVGEIAAAYVALKRDSRGEGWLLARELVVDLQLPPLNASPTLLGLVRAKQLAGRTLGEKEAEAPVMAVRRGYWEWKLARVQVAIDAKRAAMRVQPDSSGGGGPVFERK